ncbi:hypothetical protein D9V28_08515 [Mycetocola zhadangensis]|uniref:DUF7715 domain-containing protein n=2 Tax=Mycetocola zhadangensis TaxID=1164595 RepID=A0A3L7J169_9MICO|nr:hypothetical protein D9V28_08515 [Mycetocola zhadangensis]
MEDIMKVLVAPPVVENADGSINSLAVEGELVLDPGPCSCEVPDCVGGFSFIGAASGRLTCQAVVADLPYLDIREFREIVVSGCCRECARDGYADQLVRDSRFTANRWPVGSVVGRCDGYAVLLELGTGY